VDDPLVGLHDDDTDDILGTPGDGTGQKGIRKVRNKSVDDDVAEINEDGGGGDTPTGDKHKRQTVPPDECLLDRIKCRNVHLI
jgi:hypothetical protein